jgi:histidinol-phosphatase (PHP family)
VAARHDDVKVLLGVEAEFVAGQEAALAEHLSAWPFEVVVLGVHEVDGFIFDDPALRKDPRWDDPDALLVAYYRTVRRACEWGRFDIFAHLDYIGLWGHRPGPTVQPEIEAALDALAASGAAIELNTDRFSDPVGVMYPSVAILRAAHARGISLAIDSDAHEVEEVGRAWEEAIALAREAGYRETLRLSDRALVPLPD